MAYSTINKSSEHFKTKLYSGNGSTNAITGVGFQPDWVWVKSRGDADGHKLFDSVRGALKVISSNNTDTESTYTNSLASFDSDGFTVGSTADMNDSGDTFASWNWKAGGTGSANTDGTINSTVSVNTTAGFSIVKWSGTNAQATIGHGLGVAPSVIIVKNLTSTVNWLAYFKGLGANKYMEFNLTNVAGTSNTEWGNTHPTSTVFTVGNTGSTNTSGADYVAYCFADIQGYSKSGVYHGGDKTFVYTGFKPRFILGKEASSSSNYHWHLFVPEINGRIETSNTVSEYTDYLRVVDWNSNGFRWGTSLNNWDRDDRNYVYIAFGQSMVGSNNVPCTAGTTDG